MTKIDGCIIRYRVPPATEWTYEICTDDDLQLYEYTRDDYQRCSSEIIKWSNSIEFETLCEQDINLSDKMVTRLSLED